MNKLIVQILFTEGGLGLVVVLPAVTGFFLWAAMQPF
jgi:hypothetical protein